MDLACLLEEGEAPDAVVRAARDLVALKAVSREMGSGTVPEPLGRFVADELRRAADARSRADARPTVRTETAAYFRSAVARFGPADRSDDARAGRVIPAPVAAGR